MKTGENHRPFATISRRIHIAQNAVDPSVMNEYLDPNVDRARNPCIFCESAMLNVYSECMIESTVKSTASIVSMGPVLGLHQSECILNFSLYHGEGVHGGFTALSLYRSRRIQNSPVNCGG